MHVMRRTLVAAVVSLIAATILPADAAQRATGPRAVIFVHGMGSSAADIGIPPRSGGPAPFGDLLRRIADRYPRPDACQRDAQRGRPWTGSPCVFRYVEDVAEADEGGRAAAGPNDSQSSVTDNAAKLAREIEEVSENTGGEPAILIGYSMGGAIIRTYLALHREEAEERVAAVVLIDPVASGSWGYAFAEAVPRRASGRLSDRLTELMRSLAASTSAVDFSRPATRDLRPRSALFRRIAPMELPRNIDYYTFWGDIRISIERRLLAYHLPDFELPSVGDLGLLSGDADPRKLPELGGQRFSPPTDDEHESLDVPHTARIELNAGTIADLIASCGRPDDKGRKCRALVARHFDIPNTHTSIPSALARVEVDVPELGGDMSLFDAVLETVSRNS